MSATLPKYCFTCREITAHDFAGVVGGHHLYKCATAGCTAAAREITPREEMTSASPVPAPKPRPERPRPAIKAETIYINRRKEKPMPAPKEKKTPTLNWIEKIVARVVDERLAAAKSAAGMTRENVIEILNEQLGMESASEEKSDCPRGAHKYKCPSAKCIAAGYGAPK